MSPRSLRRTSDAKSQVRKENDNEDRAGDGSTSSDDSAIYYESPSNLPSLPTRMKRGSGESGNPVKGKWRKDLINARMMNPRHRVLLMCRGRGENRASSSRNRLEERLLFDAEGI